MTTTITCGEAVNDTSTALGRAAAQTASDRAKRLAAARLLMESEGITLEEAVTRVLSSVAFAA